MSMLHNGLHVWHTFSCQHSQLVKGMYNRKLPSSMELPAYYPLNEPPDTFHRSHFWQNINIMPCMLLAGLPRHSQGDCHLQSPERKHAQDRLHGCC